MISIFVFFLSVASGTESEERLARKLGRKYPESLAEKKTEGVFCAITKEGQEESFYQYSTKGLCKKYLSKIGGFAKILISFVPQVLSA